MLICCLNASSSFCKRVSYLEAEFGLSFSGKYFCNSSSSFIDTIISIDVFILSTNSFKDLLINWSCPISSLFSFKDAFDYNDNKYIWINYLNTSSTFLGFINKYKFIKSFFASIISFLFFYNILLYRNNRKKHLMII